MAQQTLTIKVDIDSSGAVTGGKIVGRTLEDIGKQGQRGSAQAQRSVDGLTRSINSAKSSLIGFFGVVGAVRLAQQLAGIADEYTNIGARLKLASGNTVSFAAAQRAALQVAQNTASSLSTTADLIEKLATSFRSLGGDAKTSFDVAVKLSETISKAVALSGASASAASAAITQLGQGLASGTLRGDELNSVLEQTPRLAQAIAKGMGVTIGQLRALGAAGKITAKQIVEALHSQASTIDKEYAQLPLTIGRAWTQLRNSVTSYIGLADQASGASAKLARVISDIAGHIDDIARAIVALGEIVATVYATKMILSGTQWIANLRAQSTAIAANEAAMGSWGARMAASFKATKADIGMVGIAIRGIGIAFRGVAAGIVGWQIGSWIRDQFSIARVAADYFVRYTLQGWEQIKYGAQVLWLAVKHGWTSIVDVVKSGIAGIENSLADAAEKMAALPSPISARLAAAATSLRQHARDITPDDSFSKELAALNDQHATAMARIKSVTQDMLDYDRTTNKAAESTKSLGDETQTLIGQLGASTAATKTAATAQNKYAQAMLAARAAAADAVAAYTKKAEPPDVQAWRDYEDALRKVAEAAGKQIELAQAQAKAGNKAVDVAKVTAAAQLQVRNAIDAMQPTLQRNLELARQKMDVGGQMIRQMQQQTMLAGLSERDAAIARAGLEYENQLRQSNVELTQQQIDVEKQRVMSAAAAAYDAQKAQQAQQQALQDFVGYWRNALDSTAKAFGDLLTGGIRKWKDFGSSLTSIARQFVADIVAQFLRMKVLGPLFNSILGSVGGYLGFGGASLGGTVLGMAANYYGGGGTIAPQGGVGGGYGGAGGGGITGYLQTGGTLYKGYQYLTGGGISLSGGTIVGNSIVTGQTAGAGIGGMNTGLASGQVLYVNNAGQIVGSATPYSPLGGSASIGGYAVPYASIGGGVLGAYYGYNHAGGGAAGVAAGVSYGALGAGIAGTAAGVAGGASVGAAAGSAFGAAAGASWIPVVGWILAALAVVDLATGGKLFGTGWRPFASKSTLSVGPEGGTAELSYVQQKQKALFGGHKWKETAVAATPEAIKAADQLFDSVNKAMTQGAQQLGIEVPQMITASLKATTQLDKHGKPEGTKYVVEYLGRTWEEATADAAAQRIGAEAIVATVAASAGQVAQQLAEQWRDNADTLLDGAQMMLAAQSDINKGNALLALGSDQTLAAVTKLVEQMQTDGESLAQTYARLAQANQQYLDFVAQFNDQIQGSGLAVSLAKINLQMQANINQANALAQAAGLQGAREQDLANIHKVAAQQAAEAMAQFAAAADQLATKLYATTGHTLAAVVQQIDALQNKIKGSVDLALGDLSPLTDQEKLDLALKGLRSGTTTADQVLSLGRKLYATGSDYTGLYNKVQEILGQPSAATATGKDEINSSLDQLNGLVQQRDHLTDLANQAQRVSDAQTLAGYVADLSTVSGETYKQVADSLGFSLEDLAKDLGTKNITAYLQNLADQDIPGSLGAASNEIVTAIQTIGRDIVQAIVGGPVTDKGPTPGLTAKGTEIDSQTQLLASIDDHLSNIRANTDDTAKTNKALADLGNVGALRVNQGVSRVAKVPTA